MRTVCLTPWRCPRTSAADAISWLGSSGPALRGVPTIQQTRIAAVARTMTIVGHDGTARGRAALGLSVASVVNSGLRADVAQRPVLLVLLRRLLRPLPVAHLGEALRAGDVGHRPRR